MKARRWVLPIAALLLSGCGYNRIQALDEQTNQQKANISTELMRRNDLIPNLVATVDEVRITAFTAITETAHSRMSPKHAAD